MDPLKLTCSQQLWLHSSVGRALHWYRRGHGFESRWSLNFFQASLSQLLKLRINREDLSWRQWLSSKLAHLQSRESGLLKSEAVYFMDGRFVVIFDTCKQCHSSLILKNVIKPMDLLYFAFQFYLNLPMEYFVLSVDLYWISMKNAICFWGIHPWTNSIVYCRFEVVKSFLYVNMSIFRVSAS